MVESSFMDAAAVMRLLGDPTRHALLVRLREAPADVAALVDASGQEQSNVSHHLRLLRDSGLVDVERRGRRRIYRIAGQHVASLLESMDRLATRIDQAGYTALLGLPADAAFHGYG